MSLYDDKLKILGNQKIYLNSNVIVECFYWLLKNDLRYVSFAYFFN